MIIELKPIKGIRDRKPTTPGGQVERGLGPDYDRLRKRRPEPRSAWLGHHAVAMLRSQEYNSAHWRQHDSVHFGTVIECGITSTLDLSEGSS